MLLRLPTPIVNVTVIQVPAHPIVDILQGIEQAAPLPSDIRAYEAYHQTARALIAAYQDGADLE
jgi:hypothetical protein